MDHPRTMRVTLRDGTTALLRPIEPGDKQRLREGLRLLSPRSRYLRFHAGVDELTEGQLRYLTEVDGHDHVAWVALNPAEPDEPGMGVARYVRLPDQPTVAEAAVTVADRYQGRGLGTVLLMLIARSAVQNGIRTLRNYVLAENTAMLGVLDDLVASRTDEGHGVYRVDMALPADPDDLPGPAAASVLRASAGRRLPTVRHPLPRWWTRGHPDG